MLPRELDASDDDLINDNSPLDHLVRVSDSARDRGYKVTLVRHGSAHFWKVAPKLPSTLCFSNTDVLTFLGRLPNLRKAFVVAEAEALGR